jgi:hypothetical protein
MIVILGLDPGIQTLLITMDSRLRTAGMTKRERTFGGITDRNNY